MNHFIDHGGGRLVLLTKRDCPACDAAREDLARIAADLGLPWEERDAAGDPEFWDRLPVLLLDGREHSYWSIDERRLRRDLLP